MSSLEDQSLPQRPHRQLPPEITDALNRPMPGHLEGQGGWVAGGGGVRAGPQGEAPPWIRPTPPAGGAILPGWGQCVSAGGALGGAEEYWPTHIAGPDVDLTKSYQTDRPVVFGPVVDLLATGRPGEHFVPDAGLHTFRDAYVDPVAPDLQTANPLDGLIDVENEKQRFYDEVVIPLRTAIQAGRASGKVSGRYLDRIEDDLDTWEGLVKKRNEQFLGHLGVTPRPGLSLVGGEVTTPRDTWLTDLIELLEKVRRALRHARKLLGDWLGHMGQVPQLWSGALPPQEVDQRQRTTVRNAIVRLSTAVFNVRGMIYAVDNALAEHPDRETSAALTSLRNEKARGLRQILEGLASAAQVSAALGRGTAEVFDRLAAVQRLEEQSEAAERFVARNRELWDKVFAK